VDFCPSVGFTGAEDEELRPFKVAPAGPAEGDAGRDAHGASEHGGGGGEVGAVADAGPEEEGVKGVCLIGHVDLEGVAVAGP